MASLKNLYEQQTCEIFAFGQLTDSSVINGREQDLASEVMASEWSKELEHEAVQKKLTREVDTMEFRKIEAEKSTNISREDARKDLFLNQKSPFLFRKYIAEYHATITKEWEQTWNPLSEDQKYRIREECGIEAHRIVHNAQCWLSCAPMNANPRVEWTFSMLSGGACSSWPGHCGHCWDGTYTHSGNVPDPKPFKVNWCLPESWK
jgi:hypothetical protein